MGVGCLGDMFYELKVEGGAHTYREDDKGEKKSTHAIYPVVPA